MKIMFSTSHFLNVNISVNIKHSHFKFSVLILTIIREGTVSQVFYTCSSFYLMHCRKCSAIWGLLDKDDDLRASHELLKTERIL